MNTILKFLEWRWYGSGPDAMMSIDCTIPVIAGMMPRDPKDVERLSAALEWQEFKRNIKSKRRGE